MRKRVCIILMGGTIACKVTGNGFEVVNLEEFCRQMKELEDYEIQVDNFRQLSGAEAKISDIVDLAKEIKRVIRQDEVDGIVVVQGTNLMEEVAFALDVLVKTDIPVICTGAMRPATAIGADGPANLIDAVSAAASEQSRGMGVMVIMNNQIHSAQYVRKEHTLNPDAFYSEFMLGYMAEHVPSFRCRPIPRDIPEIKVVKPPINVMLYTTYAGDTGEMLEHVVDSGYSGLVVEGTGAGGFPIWIREKFMKIHEKIPCVIASRTGHGDIVFNSYGYGFQQMAYEKGVCLSNILDGRKSRILLTLLLMADYSREQICECFDRYSKFASI